LDIAELGISLNLVTGIGWFFTIIGILTLLGGLVLGLFAYNSIRVIPYVSEQAADTVFMAAFTPFLIPSGIVILLGIILLYVGKSRKPNEEASVSQAVNLSEHFAEKPPIVHVETSYPNAVGTSSPSVAEGALPLPKQGVCPSCEFPIVFIEKYQRWYCVNERKYI
jgi:hypothetical protein